MIEDKKNDYNELKKLVTDIHKLHFSDRPNVEKDSLKDKFKAEILIRPIKRR